MMIGTSRDVAQPPADLDAVHAGQHQVEHDEVGAPAAHRRQGGLPVAGLGRPRGRRRAGRTPPPRAPSRRRRRRAPQPRPAPSRRRRRDSGPDQRKASAGRGEGQAVTARPAPGRARPPSGRRLEPPRSRPGRRDAPACSTASGPSSAQANGVDAEPPARRCSRCTRRPVPGAARSTTTRPPACTRRRARRSSATGSPPMPMLPSASSAVSQRPSWGRAPKTSRCRARMPRCRARATASGARSTPSTSWPRAASSAASRPGPQPEVDGGAPAAFEHEAVTTR